MNPQNLRFVRAVRENRSTSSNRAGLTRTVAAGVILALPVACGTGDEAVFGTASSVDDPTTIAGATVSTTVPSSVPTTTVTPLSEPTDTMSTRDVFDGEMLVSFSYEPSSVAQAKRPYIAVWVEDTDGNLVDTISLWFEQSPKGSKWLNDLNQWFQASGGDDTTMSAATRIAGAYTVAWDGTDLNGDPVAMGEYFLNIESAREHGPTSFTTGTINLSDAEATVILDDDGELSAASASLNF